MSRHGERLAIHLLEHSKSLQKISLSNSSFRKMKHRLYFILPDWSSILFDLQWTQYPHANLSIVFGSQGL